MINPFQYFGYQRHRGYTIDNRAGELPRASKCLAKITFDIRDIHSPIPVPKGLFFLGNVLVILSSMIKSNVTTEFHSVFHTL